MSAIVLIALFVKYFKLKKKVNAFKHNLTISVHTQQTLLQNLEQET